MPQVLTFDEGGASGHPNHIACARGARRWLATATTAGGRSSQPELYELASHPLWLKYLGPWAALFLRAVPAPAGTTQWLLHPTSLLTTWAAMAAHASQLVWFRHIFLHCAIYPYANALRRHVLVAPRQGAGSK